MDFELKMQKIDEAKDGKSFLCRFRSLMGMSSWIHTFFATFSKSVSSAITQT
jgi:hypothetical protein